MTELPWVETPLTFGRERSLVGAACRPASEPGRELPFVVFLNAGIIHRTGPNRMSVRLARALASAGVGSLRFDLSGIGDSVMPTAAAALSIRDRVDQDVGDALALARERFGASRFVLLGLCSGADHALWAMGRVPDVVGAVLLDLNITRTWGYHLRYYGQRIVSPAFWKSMVSGRHWLIREAVDRLKGRYDPSGRPASPTFTTTIPHEDARGALKTIAQRGGRILAIFTGGVEFQYIYEGQFRRLYRDIPMAQALEEVFCPEMDHTFTAPESQRWLTDTTVKWVTETSFAKPAAEAPGGPATGA